MWFVEKDKKGESHLSSLCEYKPRENVQKGYLNGRNFADAGRATTMDGEP